MWLLSEAIPNCTSDQNGAATPTAAFIAKARKADLLSYSGATCQRGLNEPSAIRLRHPAKPPCGGLRGAEGFSVSGQCNMCLQQAGRKEAQG